jgi:hypothetical protein
MSNEIFDLKLISFNVIEAIKLNKQLEASLLLSKGFKGAYHEDKTNDYNYEL